MLNDVGDKLQDAQYYDLDNLKAALEITRAYAQSGKCGCPDEVVECIEAVYKKISELRPKAG